MQNGLNRWGLLSAHGESKAKIYAKAKSKGFSNLECLHILMVVFDISLDEARKIGHQYYYENKAR